MQQLIVNLPDIVGRGYNSFWNSRHRYRVVKGGKGSKKSTTITLWMIYNIMKHPFANALVVRAVYATHKDSTFAQLKWAAERLKVYDQWEFTVSPLECTYKPTGQKILFRGLDDPLKLASITVPKGVLCWTWWEEVFEVEIENSFDMVDYSIRGELPEGLWKQHTLTFNPWVCTHWTKTRFFDSQDPDAFTLTTTHKCNEWLTEEDHQKIEALKDTNPSLYRVIGLGEYGLPGGAFFEEFDSSIHVIEPFEIPSWWRRFRAMDYGYDMLAVAFFAIDTKGNLIIYKEIYQSGLTITKAAQRILIESQDEQFEYTVASPDLWKREGQQRTGFTGMHEIDYMFQEGLENIIRADNARVPGWRNLREYLNIIDDYDIHGNVFKNAKLKIFSTCKNVIRTLSSLTKNEHNSEDAADTPHEITHMPECLIGNTLVLTSNGEKPIKDIQIGDKVLTRKGFQTVLDSKITGMNERVLKVVFSNKKTIIGTEKHPVWVKGKGFISIDSMRYGDIIEVANTKVVTSIWRRILSFLIVKNMFVTRSRFIVRIEDIISAAKNTCITRFGNILMVIFQEVLTFITKILIQLDKKITRLKIWNAKQNSNTCLITGNKAIKAIQKNLWIKSDLLQQNGTERQQEENLLESHRKNFGKTKFLKKEHVLNAVKILSSKLFTIKHFFVQTLAGRNIVEKLGQMMKKEYVKFVVRFLKQISTVALKIVQHNAVRVVGVYPAGIATVYNLSVENEQEFYANGVLVHNSVRYGCMSRPILSEAPTRQNKLLAEVEQKFGKGSINYQIVSEDSDGIEEKDVYDFL